MRCSFGGGKSRKAGVKSCVNWYDYGARFYDPALGRFHCIDPFAEKYYGINPYNYVANNPVKLIDPDGREWDIKKTDNGYVITVSVNFSNEANLSDEEVAAYQSAISKMFNNIISTASDGKITGEISFDGGKNDNQVTPDLMFYKGDPVIGGSTSNSSSSVNMVDKNGNLRSTDVVASDAIHELFHTVRLDHPFERTQSSDTEMNHISGNKYSSTSNTDPSIRNNIMNYSLIEIDGQKRSGIGNSLTIGQIGVMMKEIELQKKGYGMMPKYDKSISPKANEEKAVRQYLDYWGTFSGTPVKRNK